MDKLRAIEYFVAAAEEHSFSGAARRQDNEGWVLGVVKKTWWPFAIVFAAAMAFAIYAQIHYPAARTLGEALSMAVAGSSWRPQLEALQLAGLGARQRVAELDLARVFEGGNRRLDVVLQGLDHRFVPGEARFEHAEGLDDHAAEIGRAHV